MLSKREMRREKADRVLDGLGAVSQTLPVVDRADVSVMLGRGLTKFRVRASLSKRQRSGTLPASPG